MEESAAYETVICQKNEVFVYKIPPLQSNTGGYKANEWKLDDPDWTGKLNVVAKGPQLMIKLLDRLSGELFAMSIVEQYPAGVDVQSVKDSSRYYVIRISEHPSSTRKASIGIGFSDRGDAFDFRVSLTDHFKWLKQDKEAAESLKNFDSGPKLDLGFKEGQTIKLNLSTKKTFGEEKSPKPRPKSNFPSGGGMGILPPPPGGVRIAAPPSRQRAPSPNRPHPSPAVQPAPAAQPAPVKPAMNSSDLFFGGPVSAPPPSSGTTVQSRPVDQTDLFFGGPVAAPPPAQTSQSQANSNIDLLMGLDLNATGSQPLQPVSNTK
ncbi:adaptin ear-binding coat-associated protein 2-like isoform X2 [Lineus longissimus]|uniref:adaptin ear-binding coat-associated protein 2-like isoform X2 n=1 Tax=Lineus longissimus TaxID=88925 RepID=UPI002B4E4C75